MGMNWERRKPQGVADDFLDSLPTVLLYGGDGHFRLVVNGVM